MTLPRRAKDTDTSKVGAMSCVLLSYAQLFHRCVCKMLLVPRFGITQGQRPDGTAKVRAVDNFSWSYSGGKRKRKRCDIKYDSINGHFEPDCLLKHDHLDDLKASMDFHFTLTARVSHRAQMVLQPCACVFLQFVQGPRNYEG